MGERERQAVRARLERSKLEERRSEIYQRQEQRELQESGRHAARHDQEKAYVAARKQEAEQRAAEDALRHAEERAKVLTREKELHERQAAREEELLRLERVRTAERERLATLRDEEEQSRRLARSQVEREREKQRAAEEQTRRKARDAQASMVQTARQDDQNKQLSQRVAVERQRSAARMEALQVGADERIVIGISGVSRSGKGWVSKALLQAIEATGKKATIVGQDQFWLGTCAVRVRGQSRTSEEEPQCTDHEGFARAIQENANTHEVVIAEGSQLLHTSQVTTLLNHIFMLELGRDEARRRRTQSRDDRLNPKPIKPQDFDDLLWPAHERYTRDKVAPLCERVVQLESPASAGQRDELVRRIMHAAGLVKQADGMSSIHASGRGSSGRNSVSYDDAEEDSLESEEYETQVRGPIVRDLPPRRLAANSTHDYHSSEWDRSSPSPQQRRSYRSHVRGLRLESERERGEAVSPDTTPRRSEPRSRRLQAADAPSPRHSKPRSRRLRAVCGTLLAPICFLLRLLLVFVLIVCRFPQRILSRCRARTASRPTIQKTDKLHTSNKTVRSLR